jgi:hypothetical protein
VAYEGAGMWDIGLQWQAVLKSFESRESGIPGGEIFRMID